jgi:S-adenosylmethionine synthetase
MMERVNMDEPMIALAEWVLPGHPDKLCDALADRIVGEVLRVDPLAQCGIEAACAFDHVFVTGLIGLDTSRFPDLPDRLPDWIRDTYRSAGYGGRWAPCPDELQIDLRALRIEHRGAEWQDLRHLSDDQCIAIGYAQASPETGHLPGALWTARCIAKALHARQQRAPQGCIGPDGKVIVRGTEDAQGQFTPLSVSVSLHHAEEADWMELRRHALGALEDALCPSLGDAPLPPLTLNGAGMFLCGGPTGDNGTTGKKLVMDAYGPSVPIGGGAWSGKDLHKPDRVGGMLARRLALQGMALGLGRRVRVQLEYRPNSMAPECVSVLADGVAVSTPAALEVFPTQRVAREMLAALKADDSGLMDGRWARWGHFGGGGDWWEA